MNVIVRWLIGILAAVAMATSVGLLLSKSAASLPGCGEVDSGCGEVLQSQYASWLGSPVALGGAATYGLILLFTLVELAGEPWNRPARSCRLAASAAAVVAGIWFGYVQWFVLEAFCLYCTTVHALGLVLAILIVADSLRRPIDSAPTGLADFAPAVLGAAMALMLPMGQILFPPQPELVAPGDLLPLTSSDPDPPGVIIGNVPDKRSDEPDETTPGNATPDAPASDTDPDTPEAKRRPFFDGRVTIDIQRTPILGDPNAANMVLVLYDYTCPHCRTLHAHLKEVRSQTRDSFAIAALPAPLNPACNRAVRGGNPRHARACDYARLALAVWLVDHASFEEFDDWVFRFREPPPYDAALEYAKTLVPPDELQTALESETPQSMLLENGEVFRKCGAGRLPKLVMDRYLLNGETANARQLADLLTKHFAAD